MVQNAGYILKNGHLRRREKQEIVVVYQLFNQYFR